jgi:hypothetical protein
MKDKISSISIYLDEELKAELISSINRLRSLYNGYY